MATAHLGTLLRHLHRLADPGCPRSDRHLLDDFAARGDESAFAALVARHGSMVLRVCRRVLGHEQDAEDAFQAAFLVLARHSKSIRKREALAQWLHGVAFRTAMMVKRSAARRRKHEARMADAPQRGPAPPSWNDVQTVLDEEIQKLPESLRAVFVLCVLEDKSARIAAAQLGIQEGTARSRLTRARKLLQRRLTRRGIELTALLAAVSVANSAAPASVPAVLADATTRFGLLVAARSPAAGAIPTRVAALAAGVTRAMFFSKAKIALAALLVSGLLAACGFAVASGSDEKQQAVSAKQQAAEKPQAAEKDRTVEVSGRIVDPDGQPVRGAKLVFIYPSSEEDAQKVWATSAADGRFHFSVAKSIEEAPWTRNFWEYSFVIAAGQDYGFAWAPVKPDSAGGLTLQLVKDDVPVQGRILDLQGKPVEGVTVQIDNAVHVSTKGDLTAWLEALRANKQDPGASGANDLRTLSSPSLGALFPPVRTGADGRFTIKGIGRERIAQLLVAGPTIGPQLVSVMTRRDEKIRQAPHGAPFDLLVMPTKPVVGVVRDKDTGKPLAGVTVRSHHIAGALDLRGLVRATSDKEGHYRLVGLPKGEGNAIIAEAYSRTPRASDLPYLLKILQVGDTPGLEASTVDISLKRGIWVKGGVIDKGTGRSVVAGFDYLTFADNPFAEDLPLLGWCPQDFTRKDGSFRTVALPGRGLIGVRGSADIYRMAVGVDQFKDKLENGILDTRPHQTIPGNYHTLVEVSPKEGDESITCDVFLDPGRTLKGTVFGPDGKPLAGARASGLAPMAYWRHEPLKTAEFTMWGLAANETRMLRMIHEAKKLAGWLEVRGDEKGPVRIRLESWGTLTGRLVTPEGKPMMDVTIHAGWRSGQADKDGRFRIEGLAPGLKFSLSVSKGQYDLAILSKNATDLQVKPGETKDLEDIRVKPIE
jgi:RNA polymerase sigma factor (sigma-70 family)